MAGMKGGRMRGGVVAKGAIKKGTFPRLMKYVFKYYKWHLLAVLLCLVVSAGGGLISSLFMQKNIDDIMNPGIANGCLQPHHGGGNAGHAVSRPPRYVR